jgi:hypothetical protein
MLRSKLLIVVVVLSLSAIARAEGDYKADFDRLKEMAQMYGNTGVFQSDPERAIDVCKQMDAVKKERERIAQSNADLLKQNSPEARNMNGVLKFFDQRFEQFEKAAKDYATAAPGEIDKNLAEATKMGDEAVKYKRPLYFGDKGGVKQRIQWAQTRYEVLEAIDPKSPATEAAKKKIESTREQVKKMKASLNDAIIDSNRLPEERYKGADKAKLIELVNAKWKESGVAGDVLKSGITSQDWKRDTYWRFDGTDTWNKSDKSKVQGFVVVKTSGTQATVHYINLVKDHLSSDQVTAYFFDDPKAEPDVSQKLLLKSVK